MKLFLAGGFLGSGKTTAIQQAVQYLQQQNKKAGVITNDQGEQQVDTQFIKGNNIPAEEVANSCFCCNYPALEKGIQTLKTNNQAEIIFAESVGSCTDLAATIINPLLQFNPGQYKIVLSVFADIRLLLMYLQNNQRLFFGDVTYIYQKQLEEADIIIVNKIDVVTAEQLAAAKPLIEATFANKKILYQNSLSADSIKIWVDTMCNSLTNANLRQALAIDYDIYGAGEAALAWLDEEITIVTADESAIEASYLLMNKIHDTIVAEGYPIGHLKFLIDTGQVQVKISYTSIYSSPAQDNNDIKATQVNILINARVQTTPGILQSIINNAIAETMLETGCTTTKNKTACFIPGYPRPTHRIAG